MQNKNSLWLTLISIFLLILLVISKDPFEDPGFSMFAISTLSIVTIISLVYAFSGRVIGAIVLSLYALGLIVLSFIRLLTLGSFISLSVLFIAIFLFYLALVSNKEKVPGNQ